MQQTLVEQGLDLLIYGMGSVFVFLILLVLCTYAMSYVVNRMFPEPSEPAASSATFAAAPVDRKTLAVLQAAIHEHRAKHRKR